MGIHQDALQGLLTANSISSYTKDDINSVGIIDDGNGSTVSVTPLAAACYGGRPNVVKLLLDNGALPDKSTADGRTPFYFAISSSANAKTQSKVITELLNGKANINLVCDEDKNTPLMAALIGSPYDSIIRQLVADGATVDNVTNAKGDTPRALAKQRGVENLLDKQLDTGAMSKSQIVKLIVSLVETIVSYVNILTLGKKLGGIVKRVFGMSGSTNPDIAKELPQPSTVNQLTSSVADYAKRKNLGAFFPKGSEKFFEDLAKKAAALKDDPSTDLGKPENIGRLTTLSLYEPILYLDDSGSMNTMDPGQTMTRYQLLGELVKRIASVATRIVPDELAGAEVRFINSAYTGRHTTDTIVKAVEDHFDKGWTAIGTNLREKVLKPLVYDKIAQKSDTNPIPLKRPVLVCIITDGEPSQEDSREMQNEILRCRDHLRKADFEDDAVMFCISQIGQSAEATKFLNGLREEAGIAQTTYCSTDRLDDMFQDMKSNDRGLEVWLLQLLTKPLFERDAE